MQATGHPSHKADTATPDPRAQDRFAQAVAPGVFPLRPVTFTGYGAGAQASLDDPAKIALTFPVDAGRAVRVLVNRATACEFLDSLIEATGGDKALAQRREAARLSLLKRGCRRGKTLSGPAASASAGEKEHTTTPVHKAPIATPTAAPEVS